MRSVSEQYTRRILLLFLLLKKYSNSEKKFKTLSFHFQNIDLQFSNNIGICTDGSAVMIEQLNGLIVRIQQIVYKNIISTHCFIHREQLATEDIYEYLFNALNIPIKMLNYIRASAVNTRIFKVIFEEMDSNFTQNTTHSSLIIVSRKSFNTVV